MTHSCSHCTFTAQFESALKMHNQLHHDTKDSCSVISKTNTLTAPSKAGHFEGISTNGTNLATDLIDLSTSRKIGVDNYTQIFSGFGIVNANTIEIKRHQRCNISRIANESAAYDHGLGFNKKSTTLPRFSSLSPKYHNFKAEKDAKSLGRTSSATRLLDKLRARICRSRTLFSHPEEDLDATATTINDPGGVATAFVDTPIRTESSPKPVKAEPLISRLGDVNVNKLLEDKETFGCHICSFDADRITVLDRHLLNDHKIGLENLLKLVMAKTKDGLSEEDPQMSLYGIRRPYYKLPDEMIEDGEFILETVTPKIKILKHASTNTETPWSDIPDLKNNCRMITTELEKLIKYPLEKCDKDEFLVKMQTLNECMCKFVDSSNTLKKVLAKEFDSNSKLNVREQLSSDQPFFDLCLGDRNTSRMWDRAHSDQMEKSRSKYGENNKGDKKFSAESFYF